MEKSLENLLKRQEEMERKFNVYFNTRCKLIKAFLVSTVETVVANRHMPSTRGLDRVDGSLLLRTGS
jgi:hypothetical protein